MAKEIAEACYLEEYLFSFDKVVIGSYTWGMGKIPLPMKQFVIDYRDSLLKFDKENLIVYGSGWSNYEHFCGAVDGISTILDNKYEKIKYELRFDPSIELEAIETITKFLGGENKMIKNTIAGKEITTKYAIASKSSGCKYCMQLDMFLTHVLGGVLDEDITVFKEDSDKEVYNEIKERTGAMQAPIFLNLETGEFISGFEPSKVIEFTGVDF